MPAPRPLSRQLWPARLSALALSPFLACALAADPTSASPLLFNRDIRPLLSEYCFTCHGPDAAQRKAKLRLDTREGLFSSRQGRAIVAPGAPADSELFLRLTTLDTDDLMPPPDTGKSLSAAQIALLERWIADGAPWQGHWAYHPPTRPATPAVRQAQWSRNDLDRFILARLESENLTPSPEADRPTLLRRLSLDLTGLPPTPEQVEAFVNNSRPDAYEQAVEGLLASPHHGERMAGIWLDVVRYADTDGFHADNYRSVWPYRDYVIRAFSANKPFDQFTIEQLAGDLLPHATLEQRVASTFNRLGRSTEEGGAQPKEYLAKYAAERVRAVGTVWLGSTTACAECHDHKYDPITLRDFYRLAAYFADIKEQGVGKPEGSLVPSPEQARTLDQLDQHISHLESRLTQPTPELEADLNAWIQATATRLADHPSVWTMPRPTQTSSSGGATLSILEDLSILSSGENPAQDTYTIVLPADLRRLTAFRLEALTHPDFPNRGLSRANGNFVLTSIELDVARGSNAPPQRVALASAIADFAQDGHPVALALDDKPDTGWAVSGHEKPADHRATFRLADPIPLEPGATVTVRLKHESIYKQHNVGRFRLALTDLDQPTYDDTGLTPALADAVRTPASARHPEQTEALRKHFLETTPALDPVRTQLAATRREREKLIPEIPTTLMTVAVLPRETRVLPRGNWMDDAGEIVTPAPPEFLQGCVPPAPPGSNSGASDAPPRATRLDLARWLVHRNHPLTARVFVNRLWKHFFGTAIARNLDDLGAQGEWPVHPELLDWLAVEFMERDWDVRQLVRLIVTSTTYRQSSLESDLLRQRDPHNRLYARQSRFRLPAELIRDHALSVSGLLAPTIGGPSVKPYQPAGYWDHLNFPKRTWQADTGDALYRRGLYTFWCRTFLHPSLMNFDACAREEATADRVTSNTPLQALTLLNDPSYVEAARAFGQRILRHSGPSPDQRVEWAFQQTLTRPPAPPEKTVLLELYEQESRRFSLNPESASQLLSVGQSPRATDLPAPELAAWTSVARTLLNLHESITRN